MVPAVAATLTLLALPAGCAGDDPFTAADAGDDIGDVGAEACEPGFAGPACAECVVYVDGSRGDDSRDGLSWGGALATVQRGIDVASARRLLESLEICSVWVRAGLYLTGTSRSDAIELTPRVHVYGGFAGDEDRRERRDFVTHETILSGDLARNDDPADPSTLRDNAYHVLLGADETILDGFTITAGVADGEDEHDRRGGGIYNDSASPVLANLVFVGNTAYFGGAIRNRGSSAPVITDVTFLENRALESGGALYSGDTSAPVITNGRFLENASAYSGGAIANFGNARVTVTNAYFARNEAGIHGGAIGTFNDTTLSVTNGVFLRNSAAERGGAIHHGDTASSLLTNVSMAENEALILGGAVRLGVDAATTIQNSVLWASRAVGELQEISSDSSNVIIRHSLVQGGLPANVAEQNFLMSSGDDPAFRGPEDLRLSAGSPAIDTGDSTVSDLPEVDAEGHPRIVDGGSGQARIDRGAYEYQP